MKIEIKKAEKEVINWDKPQLVIADNGDFYLTDGCHEKESFSATRLVDGYFLERWFKSSFKPFHGTITLSND